MTKKLTAIIALVFFSNTVSAVTLTSNFTITNRVIEKSSFTSTEPAMTYTDNGSGFYTVTDTHSDANRDNLNSPSVSTYWGYGRRNSLVTISLKGKRLGHNFNVYGKIGDSSVMLVSTIPVDAGGNIGLQPGSSGTCSAVGTNDSLTSRLFYTNVSSTMINDGVGCRTIAPNFGGSSKLIKSVGVSRVFYLDLQSLQNDAKYRAAPPDVYSAVNTFNGNALTAGAGNAFRVDIPYINDITIIKKPYFDNVTLLSQDNNFTVKTVGSKVNGSVTVPYVMNGQFTPYDRVTLNVTSLNNFSLVNSLDATKKIPYSLSTSLGTRKFQLATQGAGGGTVLFTDLPKSVSAMQGRYDASFSVDKTSVVSGEYTDTLTAVYQIDLVS